MNRGPLLATIGPVVRGASGTADLVATLPEQVGTGAFDAHGAKSSIAGAPGRGCSARAALVLLLFELFFAERCLFLREVTEC